MTLSARPAQGDPNVFEAPRSPAERSGGLILYESRPAFAHELRGCSFRHPVCVHAERLAGVRGVNEHEQEDATLRLLEATDEAWDTATGALALPAPETLVSSTGALDLYLVDGAPNATRVLLDRRDPTAAFDRSAAFALVGRGGVPGCTLDRTASLVVARAILFAVAPATDDGSALAESAFMARLMVPCAPPFDEAMTLFQAHPELGLAETLSPPNEPTARATATLVPNPGETYATGASSFYAWLDGSFGAYPGATVRAIWALTPTRTPSKADRWVDEPDGFDVLRTSFKNALFTDSTVDDLWLDFAVARAENHEFPVRLEWSVPWPGTPRTLTSGVGVEPTGSAYIRVNCLDRPLGSRLRFEATWEEHASMQWTLVRIDAQGSELSRVGVPAPRRATSAGATLVDLDGVAEVLIVGSNAGDPLITFDPDDYAWEPHGWVVSLLGQ